MKFTFTNSTHYSSDERWLVIGSQRWLVIGSQRWLVIGSQR